MQILFDSGRSHGIIFDKRKSDKYSQTRRGNISGFIKRIECIQTRLETGFISNAEGRKQDARALNAIKLVSFIALNNFDKEEQQKIVCLTARKYGITPMQAFFKFALDSIRVDICNDHLDQFLELFKVQSKKKKSAKVMGMLLNVTSFDAFFEKLSARLESVFHKISSKFKIGFKPYCLPTINNESSALETEAFNTSENSGSENTVLPSKNTVKKKSLTFTTDEYKALIEEFAHLKTDTRKLKYVIGSLADKYRRGDFEGFGRVHKLAMQGRISLVARKPKNPFKVSLVREKMDSEKAKELIQSIIFAKQWNS